MKEIVEKLILRMLCDLYKNQKVKNGFDPDFISKAIDRGYYWALDWEYHLSDGTGETPQIVLEVCDVLEMWSSIEQSYAKLSMEDKERVESEAESFGKNVAFQGFDGNNENAHFGIAQFLIDDLKRYVYFKGRDLNSHYPSIDAYRRMLVVSKPMQEPLASRELSASQIIDLLKARKHPGE